VKHRQTPSWRREECDPDSVGERLPEDILRALRHSDIPFERLEILRERIRQMILSDLTPVKPMPSVRAVMLSMAAGIVCGAVGMSMTVGTAGLQLLSAWQSAMLTSVGALLLVGMSYILIVIVSPGHRRRLRPGVVLLLSAASVVTTFGLVFQWDVQSGLNLDGSRCARGIVLGSLPTVILLCALLRRGAFLEPVFTAAMIAAAAGAGALAATQLACPMQEASHLLLWHAGPWLLLISLAALAVWAIRHFRRLRGL